MWEVKSSAHDDTDLSNCKMEKSASNLQTLVLFFPVPCKVYFRKILAALVAVKNSGVRRKAPNVVGLMERIILDSPHPEFSVPLQTTKYYSYNRNTRMVFQNFSCFFMYFLQSN